MANASYQVGQAPNRPVAGGWGTALADAAQALGPPLLYALRLWASVCFALYVAFWLQLDNAYWPALRPRSCASRSSGLRCARRGSG